MLRAAAIAAVIVATLAARPASQPWELALALIRADGILVPFAVFDGSAWTAVWHDPEEPLALESPLAATPSYWLKQRRPVPRSWHVLAEAETAREVGVLSFVVFDEHCQHQVGLLTDLQPRRADPHEKRLAADRAVPMTLPLNLSEFAVGHP